MPWVKGACSVRETATQGRENFHPFSEAGNLEKTKLFQCLNTDTKYRS
ncbi:hypothetical protein NBRC3257_0618 [Gluconobacter thailandicus NBRC 3257]|uniref:Uncharacterized protein n=1 Tax=Gluconobacter thailandicus NBRC 3257 TaxID=1381097 RepID=A0ABQ0ITS2_GLUTH|nr:hypothetical protein NBRC3255_3198 [Gluconobacter thailandicus NBRC 3255]GAD25619.1 hypothetical protein NBRC3257_0618 [Gluconobacter thailandicus NBRC 3257]